MIMPSVECVVAAPDGVSSFQSKLSQQNWGMRLLSGMIDRGRQPEHVCMLSHMAVSISRRKELEGEVAMTQPLAIPQPE